MTRLMHREAWHRHCLELIWILASETETHPGYLQSRGMRPGRGRHLLTSDFLVYFVCDVFFFEGGPWAGHLCNANCCFQRTLYIKMQTGGQLAGWFSHYWYRVLVKNGKKWIIDFLGDRFWKAVVCYLLQKSLWGYFCGDKSCLWN